MKTKSLVSVHLARAKRDALATAHRAALRPVMFTSPVVRQTIMSFPPALRERVSLNGSNYGDQVTMYLTMRDLDSLKDKRLTKLLEKFAGDEWVCRTSDYTYAEANRDFVFTRKVSVPVPLNSHTKWLIKDGQMYQSIYEDTPLTVEMEIQVFISAYVKSDSPLCRIEVVERNERVVIDEVKRIVCA